MTIIILKPITLRIIFCNFSKIIIMKVILSSLLFLTIFTTATAQDKKIYLLPKSLGTTNATAKDTNNYYFLKNVDLVRDFTFSNIVLNDTINFSFIQNAMPCKKQFSNAAPIPNACTAFTKMEAVAIPNVLSTVQIYKPKITFKVSH